MNISKTPALLVLFALAFGFLGGMLGAKFLLDEWEPLRSDGVIIREEHSYYENSDLISAVEKVMPAVVTIQSERPENASGTGFVVSPEGLVLTNKHVVNAGSIYNVVFENGDAFEAELLTMDPFDDVAVLSINRDNLPENQFFPTVIFANSDNLRLGQSVIAVGNSLAQFSHSVSSGIISAKDRLVQAFDETGMIEEKFAGLLQTDAAVNLGGSGGPLVNMSGEVVGMNTAVVENGKNIAFSIPSNDLKPILRSIEEFGVINRPVLGVRFLMLNESQAKEISETITHGALIVDYPVSGEKGIMEGSAAQEAGLMVNDVILSVNGTNVDLRNPLNRIIRNLFPGDRVIMEVFRNGGIITLEAKLGSYEL